MHKSLINIAVRMIYGAVVIALACYYVWSSYWFNSSSYDVNSTAVEQMIITLPGLIPATVYLFRQRVSNIYFGLFILFVALPALAIFIYGRDETYMLLAALGLVVQILFLWVFSIVSIVLIFKK